MYFSSPISFCHGAQPILTKRITKTKIEWRIRNLTYPREVYNVTVEPTKKAIVVRTTNKKYYKSIDVPEVDRCQITLEQESLTIDYKFNTLIVTVILQYYTNDKYLFIHECFNLRVISYLLV